MNSKSIGAASAGLLLLGVSATASLAQTGPDLSLDAITPQAEAMAVGLSGSDPADIARYLLADGAGLTQLSPDGKRIAFRRTITGSRQLWVIDAEGGQPKQLTFGNGITFFAWSPDSQTLIYGADNNGDEQESYYRIAADGSSEELILPAVDGGFRNFGAISANGETIAYASTERNGLDFDIYTADLATKEANRVYEGKFGFYVEAISPDGNAIAISQTVGEDADNLYFLDISTGETKTISKPEERANHSDAGVTFSQDGSTLYFASSVDREFTALTAFDLASGTSTVVADADHDIENVTLCGKNDQFLAWTINADGFDTLMVRDQKRKRETSVSGLPEGKYRLSCAASSPALAVLVNGWRSPGDIYLVDLAKNKTSLVFGSSFAGLDPERFVRPESIRLTARDGVELQGMLYLPDASSRQGDGPPPVIFEVHGGPSGQASATFRPAAQYYVDRGIAVFEPNVRGSTGFGRTYSALDDKEKRLDSVRDLIDMLDFLKEDGRVDTSRAAVAGGSYGGYVVNAVLANYPDAFKAGVSRYSVADWVTALEIASPALKASDILEYGDITDPYWKEFYSTNSPIRQADNIKVPVLFSHGVMDPRIDISETETMVRALRKNGVEATYIRIPDEGHGWRKISNRLFYYRRETDFLDAQLSVD